MITSITCGVARSWAFLWFWSLRRWLPCLSLVMFGSGCGLTLADLQARNPKALAATICDWPAPISDHVRFIAYQKASRRVVTDEDELQLNLFAPFADAFYERDPNAPSSSVRNAPKHWGLTCTKASIAFPNSAPVLPESAELFRPCSSEVARADTRPDPRLIADPVGPRPPCNTTTPEGYTTDGRPGDKPWRLHMGSSAHKVIATHYR